ncbi:putative formaldehyde dehydrogenase AdhA [Lachnellula suecica]|uniref:Putative formaldehyde dehydrogenase AdhA n=1 Tax=Lachnellula suecica TaxID=602035 RepID=A0A8T9CCR1_9HELO|nr:putative formaldehyde dehydrogenase AdhA [Lachnellula suecica]
MVSFTVFKGSQNGKIVKSSSTREVGPDQVLVKVTHAGLCGTDEHRRHDDMVLGHEGTGMVERIGGDVKTLSIGDRIGWGFIHSSCLNCEQCLTGHENLCPDAEKYGSANLDQGAFGTYAVWKASYVFKIPSSMAPEHAAPLMCGGATVFHVLRAGGAQPTDRVGVIGVGGLGHLAIQFASKMGCEVVVFSSTENKRDEATKLGAKQFFATKGKTELDIGRKINHLIVTTSMPPDWNVFLPLMAPRGTIYPVTVSADHLELPYTTITRMELRVQGSFVAPRQVHKQMIEFAALHGIKPIIEEFPLTVEGITEAMEKLNSGKMRYRGVLLAQ